MPVDQAAFGETLDTLVGRLLANRNAAGHWEGCLASSALSTATALIALAVSGPDEYSRLIERGVEWLVQHQNDDGGWGDTALSLSNISTTALVWAALSAAGHDGSASAERAGAWLTRAAGGPDPETLSRAIVRRYGEDHTFSVPILTALAITGRLGPDPWRLIPQLPFELAACPHQWFRWLRLPVVSYALPALIAMGLARHRQRPARNPVSRGVRDSVADRTLAVLESVQPASGGFLEATPLTSFVSMSLVAAGCRDHPVASRGRAFLADSVRVDGSWPIDTNLATWLTTLSVNALAGDPPVWRRLGDDGRRPILDWLLRQQYRQEHPYTHAAPGGWAWTDLSGGVPDADDTAGALLCLHNLAPEDPQSAEAAAAAVGWLLDLQNRDGGMPTFCRGWGKLPFDRSGADLTAHALAAWTVWLDRLPPELARRTRSASRHAVRYLTRAQRPDGAWVPLWFGNQFVGDDQNPLYGTARVVTALEACGIPGVQAMRDRAIAWVLANQNQDGGWGGERGAPSSIEETGLALDALGGAAQSEAVHRGIARGAAWLVQETAHGSSLRPSPIGFYFARLWYFEELYPLIFSIAGLAKCRGSISRLPDVNG